MKLNSVCLLTIICTLSFSYCHESLNGPDKEIIISNPVAMTARINGIRQIAFVDYDDPGNFILLTDNDHQNVYPKFSPGRKKLIYQDLNAGTSHNPLIKLYQLDTGITTSLFTSVSDSFVVVGETPFVWNKDGTIVYYRFRTFSADDPFYYSFVDRKITRMLSTGATSEYVFGLKGADTLFVFTNDTATTKQKWGFYYADLDFHYLSYIDNPYLELINRNGVNLKAAYNPRWNDDLGLFVYAQSDSSLKGFKIAVTDLTGTYYRPYTSGDFIDDHPCWGPDGKTILFNRREISDHSGQNSKVMIITVETGNVWVFVNPGTINGATALFYPDY